MLLGLQVSLLVGGFLAAQQPGYVHYTMEDGLPSNNIYKVVQDTFGYLWIGTDYGVARFDGRVFESFTLSDGLKGNDVFALVVDAHGQVGLNSLNGACKWNGKRFVAYEFPSLTSLFVNQPDGSLLLRMPRWDFRVIHSTGHQLHSGKLPPQDTKGHLWLEDIGIFDIPLPDADQVVCSHGATFYVNERTRFDLPPHYVLLGNYSSSVKEHLYYFSEGLQELEGQPYMEPDDVLVDLVSHPDGRLIVGTERGLLYLSLEGPEVLRSERYFESIPINSLFRDHEGNIWVATRNQGLLFLPSTGISHYETGGKPVFALQRSQAGNLYWGSEQGWAGAWQTHGVRTNRNPNIKRRERTMDRLRARSGDAVFLTDRMIYRNEAIEKGLILPQTVPTAKSILEKGNQVWWLGTRRGILEIKEDAAGNFLLTDTSLMWLKGERVMAMAYDENQGELYAGTVNGLFRLKEGEVFTYTDPLLKAQITDLDLAPNGDLYLCTSGLGFLRLRGEEVTRITRKDGLPSDILNRSFLAPDGSCWLATHQGVAQVLWKGAEKPIIRVLGKETGGFAPNVFDVHATEDTLWIASENGISTLPLPLEKQYREPPRMILKEVRVNGKHTHILPGQELPYQASLFVSFTGLSFLLRDQLEFRYRLLGEDTTWQPTRDRALTFTGLPAGEFELQIQALGPNALTSAPLVLPLKVAPPWWKRPLFLVLIFLCTLALITSIFFLALRAVRVRNARIQRIRELQQQALSAQMNPHFVFNALNAIHAFIARKDSDNAHVFLGKFARLTRNILDASRSQKITLQKEIDTLKLYLELESMRFRDQFEYEFQVDTLRSPAAIHLPPMLIQPFVENALLHGIRHLKDKKGQLWITVTDGETGLEIQVRDNGVGRARSREINQQNTLKRDSHGSRITTDRISMIPGGAAQIEDLMDETGNPTGTKVKLWIPFSPPEYE